MILGRAWRATMLVLLLLKLLREQDVPVTLIVGGRYR